MSADAPKYKIKLKATNVNTLGDGEWHDAGCPSLYLRVRYDGGSRVWRQRYRNRLGKNVWLSLGAVATLTLAEAHDRVLQNRALIAQGKEPQTGKPSKAKAGVITFKMDTMTYYEWAKGGGDNETHEAWTDTTAAAFIRSFENHLFPTLGDRDTTSLTTASLAAAILPVWQTANDTGKRLCQRCHAVLEHAIATDDAGRFPERRNVVDGIERWLPKGFARKRVPMRAAKWVDMPALYAAWCGMDTMAAYALRFLCLTCAPRASEVFKMRWSEIDGNVWTVPEARMKNRVTRKIPLSDEAMAILTAIRPANAKPSDHVFTGRSSDGGRIGHQAMLLLLRQMELDLHVHGFRTTYESWGLDNLRHPLDKHAIDLALDHVIGNAVQEAYRDTGLLNHRRILADRWAAFLTGRAYTGAYGVAEPFQQAA